jgi:hypothetical protein
VQINPVGPAELIQEAPKWDFMIDMQVVWVDYSVTSDRAVDRSLEAGAEAGYLCPSCEARSFTDLSMVRLHDTGCAAFAGEGIGGAIGAN